MGNSVMLNGVEYAGEQIAYKDSTYELVSKVAYLIGVPLRIFQNEHEPPKIEIYNRLEQDKNARIIRNLCVIRTAIEVNRPDRDDVVGVLSKVGGFDLAAMCGAFLGAAAARRPAVIDGLISAAAALCAVRLCPNVRGYLVPSHASFEIGYRLAMEAMDLRPLFDLGMRLGEGSGCPLAFQVLDAACAVINDMATFDEAGINDDYLDEIRRGDQFTP